MKICRTNRLRFAYFQPTTRSTLGCVRQSPPASYVHVVSYLVPWLFSLFWDQCAHTQLNPFYIPSFLSWHHSREKWYQGLSCFTILEAAESWAGPGNEAKSSNSLKGISPSQHSLGTRLILGWPLSFLILLTDYPTPTAASFHPSSQQLYLPTETSFPSSAGTSGSDLTETSGNGISDSSTNVSATGNVSVEDLSSQEESSGYHHMRNVLVRIVVPVLATVTGILIVSAIIVIVSACIWSNSGWALTAHTVCVRISYRTLGAHIPSHPELKPLWMLAPMWWRFKLGWPPFNMMKTLLAQMFESWLLGNLNWTCY